MTTILLDTQSLAWLVFGSGRMGDSASRAATVALSRGALKVCATSFWEVAMLVARDRMTLHMPVLQWRRLALSQGIEEVSISGEVDIMAGELTNFHKDPADRIIMATALRQNATLLTSDRRILDWSGKLARLDARL